MNEVKKYLVIYHANCTDGFASAYAAWKFFRARRMLHEVEFYPCNYGQIIPAPLVKDRIVYILDFSFPKEGMDFILEHCQVCTLLDHHKTALENLQSLKHPKLRMTLDMERSGAVLSWEHFFPKIPVPLFFRYVQDRDLWQWKLEDSRLVSEVFQATPFDFDHYEYLELKTSLNLPDIVSMGKAIKMWKDKMIESILKNKKWIKLAGYVIPVCACPGILASEVGEILAADSPFAATYVDGLEKRTFSLRSNTSGVDVTTIAKQFGGGGHKAAAGFSIFYKASNEILEAARLNREDWAHGE